MKAKLIVEGREFELEILDEELQKLVSEHKVHTGYERARNHAKFFCASHLGQCLECIDNGEEVYSQIYNSGNYYSDKHIAENNTRADNLMRQLRRFSVEHRNDEFNWCDSEQGKWSIFYDAVNGATLDAWDVYTSREFNSVYFDSYKTAKFAIETFHDELMWYFTEYKDSL
jgi:hypothetical protein